MSRGTARCWQEHASAQLAISKPPLGLCVLVRRCDLPSRRAGLSQPMRAMAAPVNPVELPLPYLPAP